MYPDIYIPGSNKRREKDKSLKIQKNYMIPFIEQDRIEIKIPNFDFMPIFSPHSFFPLSFPSFLFFIFFLFVSESVPPPVPSPSG